MKILLAIDGSPCSEAAVNEVTKRPWPTGSEIRIISAFEVPFSPSPEAWAISSEYFDQMERVAREQAQAVVDAAAANIQHSRFLGWAKRKHESYWKAKYA